MLLFKLQASTWAVATVPLSEAAGLPGGLSKGAVQVPGKVQLVLNLNLSANLDVLQCDTAPMLCRRCTLCSGSVHNARQALKFTGPGLEEAAPAL